MALHATHNETKFGVGDVVRVTQVIQEGDKTRTQGFEGMVIGIKGRGVGKTFTVRRMGAQQVGIEKIFPLAAPVIEKIEVTKKGTPGVKRAKLYYTRGKSRKEVSKIYSRLTKKELASKASQKTTKKKKVKKSSKRTRKARSKKSANASKKK